MIKIKITTLLCCSLLLSTAMLASGRRVNPQNDLALPLKPLTAGNITHVWANEGGDKVTQDELRATQNPAAVHNSVWDGAGINLFGAHNEVVAFNLILEAPTANANTVGVNLSSLTGPGGQSITTRPASGEGAFDYTGRNLELFYVRYLEIKGLSLLAYEHYDERHIPARCRRPFTGAGYGTGLWTDRPCHNKLYPDIAVPLELSSPFTITAGTNQAIWGDIYIPKTVSTGVYTGTISVTENHVLTWQIPLTLTVRNFSLPDLPTARTMLFISDENINDRYLGTANMYPNPGTSVYTQSLTIADRHFQLAHRHKISLIEGYTPPGQMADAWTARLSGALFTPAHSYSGIGEGTGNNVYSIGTYGSWPWQSGGKSAMWVNSNAWVNWFDQQAFTTPSEYFLYLIDESDNYPQTEQWAQWIEQNSGSGRRLPSMATIDAPSAQANTPTLDIAASWSGLGIPDVWQKAVNYFLSTPGKRYFMYNGVRPTSGSFAIEDDGVALRTIPWAQYKMGIQRWFYWESTFYTNWSWSNFRTNVFHQAQTYGTHTRYDNILGETGNNYTNGDGVLFYPGKDTVYPADSYGVMGPFASLRLKLWRRGIQDVDYLTLAQAVDPCRVGKLVQQIIPKVFWQYGVDDPGDPTWVRTDISWFTDPDTWEAARLELADIIEGKLPVDMSCRRYLPWVARP